MKRWKILAALLICLLSLCACEKRSTEKTPEKTQIEGDADASTTPFGRYKKTVTYTLGKMTGLNHSNMPEGDTYENNAYTRYLKKKINIQNEDVFEASESDNFSEAVSVAIASKNLPDVMVINDMDTLQMLVKNDMIADLTEAYERCASTRIKEIYQSYGDTILDNVTFDGKLMALPETNIENGPSLLWLRKDWMDKLGLKEPKTLEEAEHVIQMFVEKDPGGNGKGKTIGLACDDELTGGCDFSYEYQTDIIFANYGVYPKHWYEKDGKVVYGSVQPQAKQALKRIRKMYENGMLDQDFLLRGTDNVIDAVTSGKCGSFFGPWWAPNNPLMAAMQKDPDAIWMPYLIETDKDGSTSFVTQSPSTKWVVVRKGYAHPEIVMKIVSVLFGETKFGDADTTELTKYYQENVDPTARPLAINVDYYDALFRCYDDLKAALTGKKAVSDLGIVEGSYFESCYRYQRTRSTSSWEDWAAYTSRITACRILKEGKVKTVQGLHFSNTATMKTKWWNLKKLEKQVYLEIVTGQKPLSYFDDFVKQWNRQGGKKITQEVVEKVK